MPADTVNVALSKPNHRAIKQEAKRRKQAVKVVANDIVEQWRAKSENSQQNTSTNSTPIQT